jgi:hypothetical protein
MYQAGGEAIVGGSIEERPTDASSADLTSEGRPVRSSNESQNDSGHGAGGTASASPPLHTFVAALLRSECGGNGGGNVKCTKLCSNVLHCGILCVLELFQLEFTYSYCKFPTKVLFAFV